MFKQVLDVASANQAAYAGIQAFADSIAAFSLKYKELNTLATQHATQLIGITEQKNELRELTAEKAVAVAGGLRAFAKATHNTVLGGKLKFGKHLFEQGTSVAIGQRVELVLQLAAENLTDLGPFGITQQHIDELTALYNELTTLQGAPRTAIIARREIGSTIESLFDELDSLLHEQLDELALLLKASQPAFFHQYRDARKIVDSKGKSNKPAPPQGPGDGETPGSPGHGGIDPTDPAGGMNPPGSR